MIREAYRRALYSDLDNQYKWKIRGRKPAKPNGKTIVDYGCGWGFHLIPYWLKGYDCYAIDTNQAALDKIAKYMPGVKTLCWNLNEALPLQPKSVHLVMARHVIEHLQDDEHAVNDIRAILARGGELIIAVPNKHNWYSKVNGRTDKTHLREYTRDELIQLLSTNGFDLPEKVKRKGWHPPVGLKVSNLLDKFLPLSETYAVVGWFDNRVCDLTAVPSHCAEFEVLAVKR